MQLEGLFNLQIMLFLEIGLGWFLRKKELITAEGKRVITDLVIDVFLPCNIIQAFQMELTREVLMSSLQILLVSIVLQLFCTVISATCYRREKRKSSSMRRSVPTRACSAIRLPRGCTAHWG